jgi:hypothetical protein
MHSAHCSTQGRPSPRISTPCSTQCSTHNAMNSPCSGTMADPFKLPGLVLKPASKHSRCHLRKWEGRNGKQRVEEVQSLPALLPTPFPCRCSGCSGVAVAAAPGLVDGPAVYSHSFNWNHYAQCTSQYALPTITTH